MSGSLNAQPRFLPADALSASAFSSGTRAIRTFGYANRSGTVATAISTGVIGADTGAVPTHTGADLFGTGADSIGNVASRTCTGSNATDTGSDPICTGANSTCTGSDAIGESPFSVLYRENSPAVAVMIAENRKAMPFNNQHSIANPADKQQNIKQKKKGNTPQ